MENNLKADVPLNERLDLLSANGQLDSAAILRCILRAIATEHAKSDPHGRSITQLADDLLEQNIARAITSLIDLTPAAEFHNVQLIPCTEGPVRISHGDSLFAIGNWRGQAQDDIEVMGQGLVLLKTWTEAGKGMCMSARIVHPLKEFYPTLQTLSEDVH